MAEVKTKFSMGVGSAGSNMDQHGALVKGTKSQEMDTRTKLVIPSLALYQFE